MDFRAGGDRRLESVLEQGKGAPETRGCLNNVVSIENQPRGPCHGLFDNVRDNLGTDKAIIETDGSKPSQIGCSNVEARLATATPRKLRFQSHGSG